MNSESHSRTFDRSRHTIWCVVALLMLCGEQASSQCSDFSAAKLPVWSLASRPILQIGDAGDAANGFSHVVDVARFEGGVVVVADGSTQELRLFAANGSFARNLSRRGRGPGEFENMKVLARTGDSLYVFEHPPGPSQLHLFVLSKGFVSRRMVQAPNGRGGLAVLARMDDGHLLVTPGGFRPWTPPEVGMTRRDSASFGILQLGDSVVWLGTFPDYTWTGFALSSGPTAQSGTVTRFGPGRVVGTSDDRIWIGDAASGLIRIYDRTGTRVTSAQFVGTARPLDHSALRRAAAHDRAAATNALDSARITAVYARSALPRTVPYFTRFLRGEHGEMWVECFAEEAAAGQLFVVLRADGAPVAALRAPAGLSVREVRNGVIAGVHVDADGIERVAFYALRR